MKNELIAALTKQNGFSRWNLDGCAIEDIADIASRIFNSQADGELGGNDVVGPIYGPDTREFWRARYFERRAVIAKWHERAVELGFDGVNEAMDSIAYSAPPTVPEKSADALIAAIDRYWELAYDEGLSARDYDTPDGDAQSARAEIELLIRELIVKPTVPADIIADAEWLVRWLPDESQQRTYALTILNWLREHAAKIDQSQEAGNG